MAGELQLGWEIGRFALERLAPSATGSLTSVAVWQSYQAWCAKSGYVPIAEAEFIERFAKLAEQVGIGVRQVGGNLNFHNVTLQEGRGHVDKRQAA